MNRISNTILTISLAAISVSCARTVEDGPNDAAKRYLDAWMSLNYPGVKATWNGSENDNGLGIYVLESEDGTGKEVTKDGYVFVEYKVTDLEGNISSYTDKETARQLGEYDTTSYYGAKVWMTADETIQAGLKDAIVGMKTGGRKKVIVPSWLMDKSVYPTVEEYMKQANEYSNTIYEFEVKDFTTNANEWQIDSIGRFFGHGTALIDGRPASEVFAGMSAADSVKVEDGGLYGFYYKQTGAPESDEAFPSDTTIYINYTGKLLNGLVFDTTIERVAKDNGLYSSSKTYEPVSIKWGEEYGDITMGSNSTSIITGFALTLWQMKAMEKGVGVFYSPLGYGYSGSGSSIPAFSSLIFEIEIVDKPED